MKVHHHLYIIWIVHECGWENANKQGTHARIRTSYICIIYQYRCANQCEKCTNIKWFMEILCENDVQKWWFSIVGIFMPKCASIPCIFRVLCLICTQNKHTERKMKRIQKSASRRCRKRGKIDHGTREDKKTQSAHKQANALHYFSKNINLSYWYWRRVEHGERKYTHTHTNTLLPRDGEGK